jgi:Family of unknown function (DUF6011)
MTRWKWINHQGTRLLDIGIDPDGSLHNPNGYPADTVRAAVAAAEHRSHERRSRSARKAAETRRRRQDRRVYEAARRIIGREVFGPRDACYICGRGLGDSESIQRGIGSECWQLVLDVIRPAGTTA